MKPWLSQDPPISVDWKVDTSQLLVVDQAMIDDSFMGAFSLPTKNLFSFFLQEPVSI